MLPRSSLDILTSAVHKPKHAAPRRTPSGFEGNILSFDAPLNLPCGTPSCAEDPNRSVESGSSSSSNRISSFHFMSPVSGSLLGSPFVDGHQEGALGFQEHRARVSRRFSMDSSTMLAVFVLFLRIYKPLYTALPLGLLYQGMPLNPVPKGCRVQREYGTS